MSQFAFLCLHSLFSLLALQDPGKHVLKQWGIPANGREKDSGDVELRILQVLLPNAKSGIVQYWNMHALCISYGMLGPSEVVPLN